MTICYLFFTLRLYFRVYWGHLLKVRYIRIIRHCWYVVDEDFFIYFLNTRDHSKTEGGRQGQKDSTAPGKHRAQNNWLPTLGFGKIMNKKQSGTVESCTKTVIQINKYT